MIFYNYTDGRRTRTSRYAGGAEYGLPVRLLFSSRDFRGLTENRSMLIGNRISGTDGFDFATPPLQAPTMSLQRKPTWKSNWNQDKHMIIESQRNGKEILNHYLILLRQGCLRHFSSLKLSWEAGDHHSVLVVNVPFLFRSQDCPNFSLLLFS